MYVRRPLVLINDSHRDGGNNELRILLSANVHLPLTRTAPSRA